MYNPEIQQMKRQRNLDYSLRPSLPCINFDIQSSPFSSHQPHQLSNSESLHNLQQENRILREQLYHSKSLNMQKQNQIRHLEQKVGSQQLLLDECEKQIRIIKVSYMGLMRELDQMRQRELAQVSDITLLNNSLQICNEPLSKNSIETDPQLQKQEQYQTFYEHLADKIMKQQQDYLNSHSATFQPKPPQNSKNKSKRINQKEKENIIVRSSSKQSHRLLKHLN